MVVHFENTTHLLQLILGAIEFHLLIQQLSSMAKHVPQDAAMDDGQWNQSSNHALEPAKKIGFNKENLGLKVKDFQLFVFIVFC